MPIALRESLRGSLDRRPLMMTTFVDSCIDTMNSTAKQVQRRVRPHARKMLRALQGKSNILITTHTHPDPDAAGSCLGIKKLLESALPEAKATIRFKGQSNAPRLAGFAKTAQIHFDPWRDDDLDAFDAIILLDTQPGFSVSPLPAGVLPTVLIDHHRGRGRRTKLAFSDVRVDVGATASIVFSYFMELQLPIDPTLAAALLYAIECDIAGAAGQQSQLDTVAISGLTLVADIRKLWQMRYVEIPAGYYTAFARSVDHAMRYDNVLITHCGKIEQVEEAALLADGLLRCEGIDVVLATAEHDGRLILSLRNELPRTSAGELIRRIVNKIGDGGGHRTKAGGQIQLDDTAGSIDKLQATLKRRLLRCLSITNTRGVRLPA